MPVIPPFSLLARAGTLFPRTIWRCNSYDISCCVMLSVLVLQKCQPLLKMPCAAAQELPLSLCLCYSVHGWFILLAKFRYWAAREPLCLSGDGPAASYMCSKVLGRFALQ